jgi:predicted Ser/Thr protein kinase
MAVNLADHPPLEILQAVNLGMLAEAEAEAILAHLEICEDCCQKTAGLPGDTFIDRLRDMHQRSRNPASGGALSDVTLAPQPPGTSPGGIALTGPKAARLPQHFPIRFGRYQLLKLLGQGGMGSVYLAQDAQLDRPVALKLPHFGDADGPKVRERFYREARAAATLRHRHVCAVYDVGEIDGTPYLTMAYVEGKPLSEAAAERPLTPRQAAILVRKLALALQEAHQKNVIHRDLKPANVMIDLRGEPILMDFGLARRTSGGDPRLTQQGAAVGTPGYMPPEQVSGDIEATGPASDVYSLGVVLYELLTGRLPFHGDAMAMLAQVLLGEPPPPSAVRPGLDPNLEAVCLKAMAKKVEDRYASMAELAAALTEVLREMPPDPEPPLAGTSTETEEIRVSQLLPLPKRAARRLPAWVWAISACLGAALLLVCLWAAGVFKVRTPGDTMVPQDLPADAGREAAVPPFNGKNLDGWQGLPDYWHVENGAIVGRCPPGRRATTYLVSKKSYRDFDLRFQVRRKDGVGNSGVQFRSWVSDWDKLTVVGPQCEIDSAAYLYPPGSLVTEPDWKAPRAEIAKVYKDADFNEFHIRCTGMRVTIEVNGVTAVDRDFTALPESGVIAWQIHGRSALREVTFRNIELKELPPTP